MLSSNFHIKTIYGNKNVKISISHVTQERKDAFRIGALHDFFSSFDHLIQL